MSEELSIYLITAYEWEGMPIGGWDTYYECVVIAPNENIALNTHPCGVGAVNSEGDDWPSSEQRDCLTIYRLGNVDNMYFEKYVKNRRYEKQKEIGCGYVVSSSYNSG